MEDQELERELDNDDLIEKSEEYVEDEHLKDLEQAQTGMLWQF